MTPNEIEVLIHCHVSPSPHPRKDAPAVQEALASFLRNGLVALDEDGIYHTTYRGAAHIAQLCNRPWPVQAWVDENGKVIDC